MKTLQMYEIMIFSKNEFTAYGLAKDWRAKLNDVENTHLRRLLCIFAKNTFQFFLR